MSLSVAVRWGLGRVSLLPTISVPTVLLIEKHSEIRKAIESRNRDDVLLDSAASLELAETKARETFYDLVIYRTSAPLSKRLKAIRVTEMLSQILPNSKFIIVSNADEPKIPHSRSRPYEWVQLPIDDEYLTSLVVAMLRKNADAESADLQSADVLIPTKFEGILTISLPMRVIIQRVIEAAAVDAPVLLTGETGTGKDLIAAAIHNRSKRVSRPFVPVNMGAFPHELIASELFGHEKGAFTGASQPHDGVFEQARGGTIFLDEVMTMDEKIQVSLLRVLESQRIRRVGGDKDIEVDTRVIAATNENIERAVKRGRFREDLYYRLDVFRIDVPPLRERPGDVSFLTNHFISRFGAMYKKTIRRASPEIYRLLRSYPWPGNVRELKNAVQRAVVMATGSELTRDLLPARILEVSASPLAHQALVPPVRVGMQLAEAERILITLTLSSVGGNKAKAASILGVSRHALYDKLKRHGLL